MQTKIHCRKYTKYKTAKQRPDETTTAKSNAQQYKYKQQTTCSQKLTQLKRLIGKIVTIKEERHLSSTQRVNGKKTSNHQQN